MDMVMMYVGYAAVGYLTLQAAVGIPVAAVLLWKQRRKLQPAL